MQIPDYYKFFNKTRIISGKKALENIPYELQSMDAVKPLVITDKAAVKDGVIKTLVKAYGDSGCVIGGVYDGANGYASAKIVLEAAELFRARGCDSIIAVGGESPASIARGVNLLVSHKTDDLLKFETIPDTMHLRPFIVIPTSDSTGRESSSQAVIDGRVYKSDELMPDIAVIDPRMLKKRDKGYTILTALGAMAEAIDACTADAANPMNDSFAFAAIQLIAGNAGEAVKGICSCKGRLSLANGIAISGIVSSNSPEGICSAVGGELSKVTGLDRALCTTMLLPYVLDYKLKNTKSGVRGELLLPLAGIEGYCAVPEKERGALGVEAVKKLYTDFGNYIPFNLKSLNIPEYTLNQVVSSVGNRFDKQYGKGACGRILEASYAGDLKIGGGR